MIQVSGKLVFYLVNFLFEAFREFFLFSKRIVRQQTLFPPRFIIPPVISKATARSNSGQNSSNYSHATSCSNIGRGFRGFRETFFANKAFSWLIKSENPSLNSLRTILLAFRYVSKNVLPGAEHSLRVLDFQVN